MTKVTPKIIHSEDWLQSWVEGYGDLIDRPWGHVACDDIQCLNRFVVSIRIFGTKTPDDDLASMSNEGGKIDLGRIGCQKRMSTLRGIVHSGRSNS